jgi:hypothetical protein
LLSLLLLLLLLDDAAPACLASLRMHTMTAWRVSIERVFIEK